MINFIIPTPNVTITKIVEDPVHREIYETYIINEGKAKYNEDKVFFRQA